MDGRDVADVVLSSSVVSDLESFFRMLFENIVIALQHPMHIFGYNLSLWQFLVADVVIVGVSTFIGQGLLGGRG